MSAPAEPTEPAPILQNLPRPASPPQDDDTAPTSSAEPTTSTIYALPKPEPHADAPPSANPSTASHNASVTDPSTAKRPPRWPKQTSESLGPRADAYASMKAYIAPQPLTILDSKFHNPRSPLAWFIDQLGIPILKLIPRGQTPQFPSCCEYELGDLTISKSVALPHGYCEPFISTHASSEASWRDVLIFTNPISHNPFRLTQACEVISSDRTERIVVAFKVSFLDVNDEDMFSRFTYEESWDYYAFNKPTLEDVYQRYGQVLNRTTEEHRNAREYYLGPWKVDGRGKQDKIPQMYEASRRFLKAGGDEERMFIREARARDLLASMTEATVEAEWERVTV